MISIEVFIFSLIGCFVLTLIIGYLLFSEKSRRANKLIQMIASLAYWLQYLWFAIIFIASAVFVTFNFDKCIQLSFTKCFNGYNVMFLFLLVLMLLPLFERFEGFGINLKRRTQNQESAKAAIEAMNIDNILSLDELKNLNKKEDSDE